MWALWMRRLSMRLPSGWSPPGGAGSSPPPPSGFSSSSSSPVTVVSVLSSTSDLLQHHTGQARRIHWRQVLSCASPSSSSASSSSTSVTPGKRPSADLSRASPSILSNRSGTHKTRTHASVWEHTGNSHAGHLFYSRGGCWCIDSIIMLGIHFLKLI